MKKTGLVFRYLYTIITVLVTFFHLFHSSVTNAAQQYKATCVLPYQWDNKGTTWILLGREQRHSGNVWFDFCGKKNRGDKKPFDTALRELKEETAGEIKVRLFKSKPFSYHSKKEKIVHFILPVYYKSPQKMKKKAKYLRSIGRGRSIEKTEWKWIKAENLLQGITGLPLYHRFKKTLQKKEIREHILLLVARGKKRQIKQGKSSYTKKLQQQCGCGM